VVLSELAPSFLVSIDTTDSVTIEISSTVLLGLIGLGSFLGLGLGSFLGLGLLLAREAEDRLLGEGRVGKESERLGGAEESCQEVYIVDHK
jgi:hypothetical protein